MIRGLSHLTFVVHDLEQATRFFVAGLGAKEIYSSGGQTFSIAKEKFFSLAGLWVVAMEDNQAVARTYNHVALAAEVKDLPHIEARLRELGVEFHEPRPRVQGEGLSLYFYDFDNHLFEVHAGSLDTRLERYQQLLTAQ